MRKKIPFLIVSIIVFIIGCISIYPDQTGQIIKRIGNSIKSNGLFNTFSTREAAIDSDNLADFLESVTITDSDGNPINDNTLHVGSKYNITISFKEQGATGAQFKPLGDENSMTYTFPPNFNVPPISNQKLEVVIEGRTVDLGTYSIDDTGKLTVNFSEQGMQTIRALTDLNIEFKLQAIVKAITGDPDESFDFGNTDEQFTFQVDNNPDLSLEKIGSYDGTNNRLSYQVTAKVSSGTLTDVEIEDDLLPWNNEAIKIKLLQDSIKVKLKREGSEIELTSEDYDIEYDGTHFKVRMKSTSQYKTLNAGDELIVNYDYETEFMESHTATYYARVTNAAEFGGNVEQPDGSKKSSSTGGSTTVDIGVVAPNNVSMVKTQEWDPDTKTLTYRIYAEVRAGTYFNFSLIDYLNVYYELQNHSLESQLVKGDVKVYATDIDEYEGFTFANTQDLIDRYEQSLKSLNVVDWVELKYNGAEYDPKDMNSVVVNIGPTALGFSFGYDKDKDTSSYTYNHDRFFKIEYQIDLSNGVTFFDNQQALTLDELLEVGITNCADFKFDNYEEFDEVYFAEGKNFEKKGVVNNRKNTIDYTVSLDIDDTENYYFIKRIVDDFYTDWGYSLTFVDDYDDGFEYVEGTLKLIYKFKDGTNLTFNYVGNESSGGRWRPEQYNDPDFKNGRIQANYRSFILSKEESTHPLSATEYPEQYLYSRMEIDSIDFVYTIQAKDSWLKAHANDDKDTIVKNTAMMTTIEDLDGEEFRAESEVPFFPARVLKDAEQEGNSNLIHFTLKINPNAIDLDKTSPNLTITDTSSGISIQYDTIVVTDNSTGEVIKHQLITGDNDHEFKLVVPDNKSLTIKYDAITYLTGESVGVTNSISINNAVRSDDMYDEILEVSSTASGGGGSAFELTIKKVDSNNKNKVLSNAKFKFYLVIPEGSPLEPTGKIGEYNVYSENDWNIETDTDGKFKIEKAMNWRLEGGNYYILVEEEAPKGYVLNKNPILFYFGPDEAVDHDKYPTACVVAPNGTITITNDPLPIDIPETGGIGVTIIYVIGIILLVICVCLYNHKKSIMIGR